jgi:uncharacterized protein (TIGR02453 family)
MEFRGWPPEAWSWFDDLEANNSKAWFHANRATYDDAVRGPMEDLIDDVMEEFGELRVSRPNRDTRFAKDKTPYKLDIYAMNRRPDGSGFYVRFGRDGLSVGGGLYAPERARLAQVREAIADDQTGSELERIVADLGASGLTLMRAGALKTAPKGYSVDHPRIDLLRLPHIAGVTEFRRAAWMSTPKAEDRIVGVWRLMAPLLDWLAATA